MRRRHAALVRLRPEAEEDEDRRDEFDCLEAEQSAGGERMQELVQELHELGIELKDFFMGLVDFPCWRDGREVYLCWKLGEPEVAHWHETDAGFAGRQPLEAISDLRL
jgi:hypothetical protein